MLVLPSETRQNKITSFFKHLKKEKASFRIFPIFLFFRFVSNKKAKHKHYSPGTYKGQVLCQGFKGKSSNPIAQEGR